MPWAVEYSSELGIIDGCYFGRVTEDDFKEATAKAIGMAKANNTDRFLIDDSEWEGGTSTVGLLDLTKLFAELGLGRGSKGALILPPSGTTEAKDAHFFETVCRNRGWDLRVFPRREEAIEWLTSD